MAFLGMNVDEVQTLAAQMHNASSEITNLMSQVTSALQSAQWVGPDHDRFVSDWQSLHTAALTSVANGLTDAANSATSNAQQQIEASNS